MAAQDDFANVYSNMYADFFIARYQAKGRLRGVVREMHGLVGASYVLKYIDQIMMSQHGAYNTPIPATNVTTTAPTITFANYQLKTSIDRFQQLNFNADAMKIEAIIHADALARMEDQTIINALNTGATKTVTDGGENLTVEKLRQAFYQLAIDEVDGSDMYLVVNASQHESIMGQTEYTSSIFNAAKPLVNPQIAGYNGEFLGFKLIVIGNRPEGGLPYNSGTGIRSCFAFAADSTTIGYRMDPQTQMVPVNQDAHVDLLSLMSLGAVVGDPRGVVKINCLETA